MLCRDFEQHVGVVVRGVRLWRECERVPLTCGAGGASAASFSCVSSSAFACGVS